MVIAQCLENWKRPQRDTAHGKEGSGLPLKTGKQATPSQTTCALTLAGARGDRAHSTRKQAGHTTGPPFTSPSNIPADQPVSTAYQLAALEWEVGAAPRRDGK